MTRRLVFLPDAEEDMRGARDWDHEQQPDLGAKFLRSAEETLARIERNPELYPVIDEQSPRAPVRRFPFAIYYEIDTDQVVIHAVWHYHRDPQGWQQRARE